MPRYVGGDILGISCSHTELGDYRFEAKANESYTVDYGGIRTNDDASGVTGGGEAIWQKNRVRWSFEGPVAVDFKSQNENKGLTALAEHPDPGVWTITFADGSVYKGKGMPVGDLQDDTNTAQRTLKVSGGGKLEKIS